jgi:hypothetical protein
MDKWKLIWVLQENFVHIVDLEIMENRVQWFWRNSSMVLEDI